MHYLWISTVSQWHSEGNGKSWLSAQTLEHFKSCDTHTHPLSHGTSGAMGGRLPTRHMLAQLYCTGGAEKRRTRRLEVGRMPFGHNHT